MNDLIFFNYFRGTLNDPIEYFVETGILYDSQDLMLESEEELTLLQLSPTFPPLFLQAPFAAAQIAKEHPTSLEEQNDSQATFWQI